MGRKRAAVASCVGFALALATVGAASAEVVDKGPQGFRLRIVRTVAAPPETVWRALGEVGRWWSPAHTYSGKAANLTMPLQANACFCETLPGGGGVRHGTVVLVIPGKTLRLAADLGPLQDEGVGGALAFQLQPEGAGTRLTVSYNVGGARDFILGAAVNVDAVMTEQADRLKRYAETGAP